MHTIEVFVGARFGGWLRHRERYPTEAEAQAEMGAIAAGERRSGATRMKRRVINLRKPDAIR